MKAVHFGAGNIGRGFVGMLLHEAGFELVFADVADTLVEQLKNTEHYTVHAVGAGAFDYTVDGYHAVNSASEPELLTEQVATADVVTTAVGPNILKFVAPAIVAGIAARDAQAPKVAVMACENAINATSLLEEEIRKNYKGADLSDRTIFANTAVDRIVPAQGSHEGLDVTVEVFHEWAVDRTPFEGTEPTIPGVTWVDDLAPYIERKLYTLNTGHASTAWLGFSSGISTIAEAITAPSVRERVEEILEETSALLVAKHGFATETQQAYKEKILSRFENPSLPDTVERVGRGPLRKLSRHDRIVGPAAELAERGMDHSGLLEAYRAALAFTPQGDPEVDELQHMCDELSAENLVSKVSGIDKDHPLYEDLAAVVKSHLTSRS